MKIKSQFKGIDAIKHKLNLTRTMLALQEKRLAVYVSLNAPIKELSIEINESRIKILQLENKITKHGILLSHKAKSRLAHLQTRGQSDITENSLNSN